MGLLPAYINKIVRLSLSERDTPGQIHAFLFFFPSFEPFTQLRTLDFHFRPEAGDWEQIPSALLSLSYTKIDTLSIIATHIEPLEFFADVIAMILRLHPLKRLTLIFDGHEFNWSALQFVSSNLEYLTITAVHCQ